MFYLLLGRYLEVELLGHITLCLTSWRTASLFSKAAVPFYIPANHVWRLNVLHTLTYFLLSAFLIIAILVDAKWYLIVALISHVSFLFFIYVTGVCVCVCVYTHTHI